MKLIRVDLKKIGKSESTMIVDYLQAGKVAVLPTDTLYGLSGRADKSALVKKIQALKERSEAKPFLVLMADYKMINDYCFLSAKKRQQIKNALKLKRPTSFILKHRGLLPKTLTAGSDGLAFRLPKNKFLRKIIKSVGAPLISTSVNLKGQVPLVSEQDLEAFFSIKKNKPQVLVLAGTLKGQPSRLLDLRSEKIKIIRA